MQSPDEDLVVRVFLQVELGVRRRCATVEQVVSPASGLLGAVPTAATAASATAETVAA